VLIGHPWLGSFGTRLCNFEVNCTRMQAISVEADVTVSGFVPRPMMFVLARPVIGAVAARYFRERTEKSTRVEPFYSTQ
jgi:hypothetical protein